MRYSGLSRGALNPMAGEIMRGRRRYKGEGDEAQIGVVQL